MLLEFERTHIAFFEAMLTSPDLIATVADSATELPITKLKRAINAADDIWTTVVNSRSGSASTFCHKPESWNYDNITKPETHSVQQHQQQTGAVQQKDTYHPCPDRGGNRINSNKKHRVDFLLRLP